ncbi:MAG: glycosyltransferase family 4 protein [Desulfovibrionaceae bacterium]
MSGEPVRVLHLCKSLGLGGTEKAMQLYAVNLDRSRFEPLVLAQSDGPRRTLIQNAGVPVVVAPDPYPILEQFKPDIVHVHRAGWPEPELMRPLRRRPKTAVVETNVFGRFDDSPSGKIIDCHIFISHFCRRRYARLHNVNAVPPGYEVLYYPVDSDLYESRAPSDRDFSRPIIARLSRADPGKWSRIGMEFFPRLLREIPEARYRIVGLIPEAEAYFREHGVMDRVEDHPPILTDAEVAGFYAEASLMAHGNDTGESFGLVIAEAMASGLPVLTHPAEGLRDNAQLELVDHGVTGLHAATAEEFAQAAAWLIRHPDEARRMGQAGQAKAREQYRAQVVAKGLEAIYDKLLAAAEARP